MVIMSKVIVSFSSIPSRIERTEKMFESIMSQSLIPDEVVVALPKVSAREGCGYRIPSFILDSGVTILDCDRDWGPATKLIPVLQREDDPDTIIVTVDDDIVYDPFVVEELVEISKKYPQDAFGFMGTRDKDSIHAEYLIWDRFPVSLLGGYRGILYRRGFFDLDILLRQYEDSSDCSLCLVDDHLFANHLDLMGIGKYVVRTDHHRSVFPKDYVPLGYPYDMFLDGRLVGLNFCFLNLGNSLYDKVNSEKTSASYRKYEQMARRNDIG